VMLVVLVTSLLVLQAPRASKVSAGEAVEPRA